MFENHPRREWISILPEQKPYWHLMKRYNELSANAMDKLRLRRTIHKSLTSHAEYSEGISLI